MVGHRMPCMRGNSMQDLWYTKRHTPVSPHQTACLLGLQRFCQCPVVTYPCITTVKPLMSLGSWLFLGLSVKTLGGGDLREGLCPPYAIITFWHWYKQSHPPHASVPLWNTPTAPMLKHRVNACSLHTIIYIMLSMLCQCCPMAACRVQTMIIRHDPRSSNV